MGPGTGFITVVSQVSGIGCGMQQASNVPLECLLSTYFVPRSVLSAFACVWWMKKRAALGDSCPLGSHQIFHLGVFDSGNEPEEESQAGVCTDKLSEKNSLGCLEI